MSEEDAQRYASSNPNGKYQWPLHGTGLCLYPIAHRLGWAEEAVAAGRDVNELHPRMGRPLHTAVEYPVNYDDRTGAPLGRYESLDLVRWLLDRGADPRLRDVQGQSAMDYAWREGRHYKEQGEPTGHRSFHDFWDQARVMMIQAARKLEGEPQDPMSFVSNYELTSCLEREAAEKGIFEYAKEIFYMGKYERVTGCVFCRLQLFGHKGDKRFGNCEYCKEERSYGWHYPVTTPP